MFTSVVSWIDKYQEDFYIRIRSTHLFLRWSCSRRRRTQERRVVSWAQMSALWVFIFNVHTLHVLPKCFCYILCEIADGLCSGSPCRVHASFYKNAKQKFANVCMQNTHEIILTTANVCPYTNSKQKRCSFLLFFRFFQDRMCATFHVFKIAKALTSISRKTKEHKSFLVASTLFDRWYSKCSLSTSNIVLLG